MTATNGRRKAITTTCAKCRREILSGPDADTCGMDAKADSAAISRTGELWAVVENRRTYELDPTGRLHRRTAKAVIFGGVGLFSSLHPEHQCAPVPAAWLAPAKHEPAAVAW
jgi:hypothetical protein